MSDTTKKPSFRKSMDELEALVTELEGGQLDIDEAIAKFEKGSKLAADLSKYLQEAQLKVDKIKLKNQIVSSDGSTDTF